jgi:hypothetical protein
VTSSEGLVDGSEIPWLGGHGVLDDILVTLNVVTARVALLEASLGRTAKEMLAVVVTCFRNKRIGLHYWSLSGLT